MDIEEVQANINYGKKDQVAKALSSLTMDVVVGGVILLTVVVVALAFSYHRSTCTTAQRFEVVPSYGIDI